MRRRSRQYDGRDARLDLTAMIDVVFLLLIFFLCAPFKVPEGELSANLPKDEGPDTSAMMAPLPPIDITLRHAGQGIPRMLLGASEAPARFDSHSRLREPDFDWLVDRLRYLSRNVEEGLRVRIDSDGLVHYDYVVRTLNACTKAGITNVRFSS